MKPKYTFTPAIVRDLMEIEAARKTVDMTVLPLHIAERLRQQARLRSTHFSTRIEGNRLTLAETERVVLEGRKMPGRERDVREVQNYYRALQQIEEWAEQQTPITERLIRRLHASIFKGSRAKPTPYRDDQNVIRDAATGAIVYMPPEADDVPGLMHDLVDWIVRAEREQVPAPVIAGLVHYQFVTIHPFYDGNGRTARALATLILYRHGYDLGRFYSLEEVYVQDLAAYYEALQTHPHHNYYEGRADADLTEWLAYFLHSMAETFQRVTDEVHAQSEHPTPPDPPELQRLDRRARIVLGMFTQRETLTTTEIARALGLSPRTVRDLVAGWLADGWLEIADPARRSRRYRLSAEYRRFIGRTTAEV
jgi:Fic family protein